MIQQQKKAMEKCFHDLIAVVFYRAPCISDSDAASVKELVMKKNVVKIELRLPELTSWEVLECKVLGGTGSVTRLHFLSFVHFCKSSRLAFRAAI